ncbi:MAG TPA: DUF3565 domain-containing protein [Acidobacteriaceae bacterium]|nr:DUF3565 domain-containing protein [Acidobacteriaceae bacterium]
MQRTIQDFQQDEHGDWTAVLDCGHTQHVRHNPPWTVRAWVTTAETRQAFLGRPLDCKKCDEILDDGRLTE